MADQIETIRNETESELRKLIDGLGPTHRRKLRDAIQVYGSARAIPANVWEEIKQDVDQQAASLLLLLVMGVYGAEYSRARRTLPADRKSHVAANLSDEQTETLRQQASQVAATAGRQVADEYVDSIRRRMATHIDDKAEEINSLPPKERAKVVKQTIDDAVGGDAAEATVVTNTTRGVTKAQNSAGDDIGRMASVQMTVVWKTERDAKVCPICRPLDGKTIDRWETVLEANRVPPDSRTAIMSQLGPPAHLNCRCSKQHVAMDRGEN